MIQLALDAQSGTALVGLFAVLALAGEWLARRGLRSHAVQYVGGSAVDRPGELAPGDGPQPVHRRLKRRRRDARLRDLRNVQPGDGRPLAAAVVQLPRARAAGGHDALGPLVATGQLQPIWGAVLAVEGLGMGLLGGRLESAGPAGRRAAGGMPRARRAPRDRAQAKSDGLIEVYRLPLLHVAEAVAVLALGFAVCTFRYEHTPASVVTAACLAAFCLLTAWGYRSAAADVDRLGGRAVGTDPHAGVELRRLGRPSLGSSPS